MKSTDYRELIRLLEAGARIQSINMRLGENELAKLEFIGGEPAQFESSENDVMDYVGSIKQTVDAKGDIAFAVVKDTERYYDELARFARDDEKTKVHEARERLNAGTVKIDYVPADLLKEFLTSSKRFGSKFLPLKEQYYEIRFLSLAHANEIHTSYQATKAQSSENAQLFDALMELMKVFTANKNFLKNYSQFMTYCDFDTGYIISQLNLPLAQLKHKRAMLAKAGGMPSEVGLQYVLEEYVTFSEPVIRFLNVVRAAIELTDGNDAPDAKLDAVKNWEIIKAHPKYGFIVEKFDPRIRNAKAHNHISIDQGVISIGADRGGGKVEKVAEYDWRQLGDMWQYLFKLLSTLSISLYMQELGLVSVIFVTPEYKLLLVGIDNVKRLV